MSESVSNPASELNPRQRAFVAEYLIDLNGTQAAIRAGYAPSSAAEVASEALRNSKVADAIAKGQAQRNSRVNISQDTVLHEMSLLALSRIDHYVVTDEGQVALAEGAPEDAMAAVQSIKRKTRIYSDKDGNETHREYDVELRLWDKPQPLKLTGRHVGLYPDRVEVVGRGGGPIEMALAAMPVDALKAELVALTSDAEKLK